MVDFEGFAHGWLRLYQVIRADGSRLITSGTDAEPPTHSPPLGIACQTLA